MLSQNKQVFSLVHFWPSEYIPQSCSEVGFSGGDFFGTVGGMDRFVNDRYKMRKGNPEEKIHEFSVPPSSIPLVVDNGGTCVRQSMKYLRHNSPAEKGNSGEKIHEFSVPAIINPS
jgi:hypothetical protein